MAVVDLVDEPGEEFLAAGLDVGGGVVVLGGEIGPELDSVIMLIIGWGRVIGWRRAL